MISNGGVLKGIFILACSFCLFPLHANEEKASVFFTHYGIEQGLTHTFIYSIAQDANGYLWLGTSEGIYRFDGYEFEYFTVENGLSDNFTQKIYCDKQGRILFGHQNGSISLFSQNSFRIISEAGDDNGPLTDFSSDELGNTWASFQYNVLVKLNEQLAPSKIPIRNWDEAITSMKALENGYFIVGSHDKLFLAKHQIDSGQISMVHSFNEYEGSSVTDILKLAEGHYLILSQETGIYLLQHDSEYTEFSLASVDANMDGALDNLHEGIVDRKGYLWVASMGNGIIRYAEVDGEFRRDKRISPDNGLLTEIPRAIFEDSEGNLWIGMYGDGLLRKVDKDFQFINFSGTSSDQEVFALGLNKDFSCIATRHSLLLFEANTGIVQHTLPLPVPFEKDQLTAIYSDEDEQVWLGFEKSGIYKVNISNGSARKIHISEDILSNSINYITGNQHYLWIATKRGICKLDRDDGKLKWFTTAEGLPHNNIRHLYLDAGERVYLSTLCSEIFYMNNRDEVSIKENSQIDPFTSVSSINLASDSTLWVSTLGNGVWKLSSNEKANFTMHGGLLSDYCYGLSLGAGQDPIVTHLEGLSRIDSRTNRILTYGPSDGIHKELEFYTNAIHTGPNGNTWLGTSQGLMKFNTAQPLDSISPPILSLKSLYIDGEKQETEGGQLVLRPGQYDLAVDYIGIHFRKPGLVMYQTFLEGYDLEWSPLTKERRFHIARLGHGTYTFRLRAYGEGEYFSELTPGFTLKVRKPLLLRTWFYLFIVLLVILSTYLIISYREKQHLTEQKRLLAKIDETTKEIIVKEEIIKERKKVEEVLIEAKVKAELSDKLKTSFLQNISHEIRTPMNAIQGFTQLLKQDNLKEEQRNSYIDIINTNSNNLLKIINDIVDLSELEADQLRINKLSFSAGQTLQEVLEKAKQVLTQLEKTELELTLIEPKEDTLEIFSDPIRVKQVLMEIITNAIKFTEKGSVTIGYRTIKNKIEFFVEDTGIGLSEDKKEVIFDLLSKIDGDPMKLYGGTGLGLALSRYLVHHLGGEIYVESALGKGSRFYFQLPLEGE